MYKDNSWLYSKVVAIKIQGNIEFHLQAIYPIPATTILHYSVASAHDDAIHVKVTDMRGSLLITKVATCNQPETLEVSNLPRGNYLISILNKITGQKIINKFVKE